MTTEVITALIAGLTTLVVSVIGYKQTLKTKKLELELKGKDLIIKESNKNFAAFTMLMDFELISIIQERIDYIFGVHELGFPSVNPKKWQLLKREIKNMFASHACSSRQSCWFWQFVHSTQ